jgi:hypothetical protein
MASSAKLAKSFMIEPEVDRYISSTKGKRSASERVNGMLKKAMEQEQYERLEAEARVFYAKGGGAERKATRAFQAAAIRAITRD